jgi:hypothetical protein
MPVTGCSGSRSCQAIGLHRPGPWIWYRGALGVRDRRKRPKSLFPFLCDIMDDDAQQGSELHRHLPDKTRRNVGYFRSYLAGLPNSDIATPSAAAREGSTRQSDTCSPSAPSTLKSAQPCAESQNARLEGRGFRQCSTLAMEHQP